MNSEGTCLRAEWSPALRWHDFYTGFYTERGNQFMDVKGEVRVGNPYKGLSTNALNWDGVVSSSEEDSLKEFSIPLFAFHTEGAVSFRDLKYGEKIGVFIGPEGGWSDKELDLFKKYNVSLVKLGNQVLRAETAAVAVSTLMLLK